LHASPLIRPLDYNTPFHAWYLRQPELLLLDAATSVQHANSGKLIYTLKLFQ
jgi:hypothetical protein